jgi:hypothetical protein
MLYDNTDIYITKLHCALKKWKLFKKGGGFNGRAVMLTDHTTYHFHTRINSSDTMKSKDPHSLP